MEIKALGLDLAKNSFQVHAVDEAGAVVLKKTLRRAQVLPFFTSLAPCLVGMEACSASHYWARELGRLGHTVRQMPANYVKPYVKRGKNDANDAEAICEAVTRPSMRFVALKSPEQQAVLSMHRARELLVKQRTQIVNLLRGVLREFGLEIACGVDRALNTAREILDGKDLALPAEAAEVVTILSRQAIELHLKVRSFELALHRWHRSNELSKRLATIPGIGPIGASALAASVTDPQQFRSGRDFAAWLGLTPRQNSTGGKERLGRITKMGDHYIRKLLYLGMTSLLQRARRFPERVDPRLLSLVAKKPARVAAIAFANRTARIAWAIMARGESYRVGHVPTLAN